jgi:hypothetical protein
MARLKVHACTFQLSWPLPQQWRHHPQRTVARKKAALLRARNATVWNEAALDGAAAACIVALTCCCCQFLGDVWLGARTFGRAGFSFRRRSSHTRSRLGLGSHALALCRVWGSCGDLDKMRPLAPLAPSAESGPSVRTTILSQKTETPILRDALVRAVDGSKRLGKQPNAGLDNCVLKGL